MGALQALQDGWLDGLQRGYEDGLGEVAHKEELATNYRLSMSHRMPERPQLTRSRAELSVEVLLQEEYDTGWDDGYRLGFAAACKRFDEVVHLADIDVPDPPPYSQQSPEPL